MDSQHSRASDTPYTRTAPPPFDKLDADIVLRSSDHVDFRVRRHILYEASPVFELILSIPPHRGEDSCPVVDLTEDHQTLRTLLLICYPVSRKKRQPSQSLPQLEAAIAAAQKYDMELPLEVLHWEVVAKATPLLSYLVSSRTDARAYARVAARYTLSSPLDDVYHPEMESSPALSYHHLLTYHEHCRKLVKKMILAEFPESSAQPGPTSRKKTRTMRHIII
ncbi:hypothetical protein C8T65DRAFT_571203 [Cerioporus squamosus]|nr:hypothetical protein C8T65DRAFT_571203 [Cerioporus squamosus]